MRHNWKWHPGVRSGKDLTFGERAADYLRNGFGTWRFLIVFVAILFAWIISGGFGTDASPYFRLNLALSCLAGLQGAIILLAAKRADRIAAEAARHHFDEGTAMAELLAQNTELTQQIHELTQQVRDLVANKSPERTT